MIYPFATAADDSAMLCQAMADMTFRMPGGFAVIPGPTGASSFAGQSSPLQAALADCSAGTSTTPSLSAEAVRAQLRSWHTRTVVVVPTSPGAACAEALFSSALGSPRGVGGVSLWSNLPVAS